MDQQRNFGFLVKDLGRLYTKRFEERAQTLQLTLPQCKALGYLSRNEGASQARLAELAEIDAMTMVRILDYMESEGWVERRADPNDRRARCLYLKDKAKAILRCRCWSVYMPLHVRASAAPQAALRCRRRVPNARRCQRPINQDRTHEFLAIRRTRRSARHSERTQRTCPRRRARRGRNACQELAGSMASAAHAHRTACPGCRCALLLLHRRPLRIDRRCVRAGGAGRSQFKCRRTGERGRCPRQSDCEERRGAVSTRQRAVSNRGAGGAGAPGQ